MADIAAFKQRVATFYNSRLDYDNDITHERALRLLKYAPVEAGQKILDVATGTGNIAIASAETVGDQGDVIGIDIARNLLELARQKISAAHLTNIKLMEIDAEVVEFEANQFDAIYCSYAIVLFANIPQMLQRWFRFLKPGGTLAFTCFSETSFLTPAIREACERHHLSLPNLHSPLGSPDRCRQQLTQAGFVSCAIHTEQRGVYRTLDDAKSRWNGQFWLHPDDPLVGLSPDRIQQLKAEFDQIMETWVSDRGVWDEATTYFVVARKP